mmetsp:Transcript_32715/g.110175  ORF Transcript_32715/g.110175 Transcript_32715/m.110175 type:complete len:277 (-) Transcript_32715:686-1516(-)
MRVHGPAAHQGPRRRRREPVARAEWLRRRHSCRDGRADRYCRPRDQRRGPGRRLPPRQRPRQRRRVGAARRPRAAALAQEAAPETAARGGGRLCLRRRERRAQQRAERRVDGGPRVARVVALVRRPHRRRARPALRPGQDAVGSARRGPAPPARPVGAPRAARHTRLHRAPALRAPPRCCRDAAVVGAARPRRRALPPRSWRRRHGPRARADPLRARDLQARKRKRRGRRDRRRGALLPRPRRHAHRQAPLEDATCPRGEQQAQSAPRSSGSSFRS